VNAAHSLLSAMDLRRESWGACLQARAPTRRCIPLPLPLYVLAVCILEGILRHRIVLPVGEGKPNLGTCSAVDVQEICV
jgi:hypothetical protein